MRFVRIQVVPQYGSTDTNNPWKKSRFILKWSDFHTVDYLSMTLHIFKGTIWPGE